MRTVIRLQSSLRVRIHKNRCVCARQSITHGCAGEQECANVQSKKQWETNLDAPELDMVLADRDKAAVVRITSNCHDWVDIPFLRAHHLAALPVYDSHHVFMLSPDADKMPPVLGEAHAPHTPRVKPLSPSIGIANRSMLDTSLSHTHILDPIPTSPDATVCRTNMPRHREWGGEGR